MGVGGWREGGPASVRWDGGEKSHSWEATAGREQNVIVAVVVVSPPKLGYIVFY